MEQIQYLNDTQKERYMLLQRFFESEYWPLLKTWANANAAEALQRVVFAGDWDSNRVAFGAHLAHMQLVNVEQTIDLEFANYAKEAQEAAEKEEEGGNE